MRISFFFCLWYGLATSTAWASPLSPEPSLETKLSIPADSEELIQMSENSRFWQFKIKKVLSALYPDVRFLKAETFDTPMQSTKAALLLKFNPTSCLYCRLTNEHYEVSILHQAEPNAFALPAGPESQPAQIILSLGLLERLYTESELAFVLAHEIAHIEADHFSPNIPTMMLSSTQLEHIANTHQNWEYAADQSAIELLGKRGFKQTSSTSLLSRLAELDLSAKTPFFRNHPPAMKRLARIRAYLALPLAMTKVQSDY